MTSLPSDPWSTPPASVPEPARPEPTVPEPTVPHPTVPHTVPGLSVPAAEPGPVIVQIAEIGVTSTVVHTPTGDIPLAGSQWQVNDFWFSTQRTPRWAVIAAIAGFCVLTVFS